MTLDQSLANLQHQADRLANLFASTADAIEARTGAAAQAVSDGFAVRPDSYGPPPAIPERPADFWDRPTAPVHPEAVADDFAPAPLDVRQDTPPGVVATTDGSLLNFEGENYVPQTPQGAVAPSGGPTVVPPAAAVEVEGPGAATPETPRPAAPTTEAPPWEGETTVAEPEKKSGRRTNEEIAAELGVSLDDVKTWKGGGRISRKDMEEFKRLNPLTVAVQQVVAATMPTQASDPMGASSYNQGGVLPATAPTAAAPAQGAPQEWPTAQPVAAQPAPGEQFGEWQQAAASESQWDPFKA